MSQENLEAVRRAYDALARGDLAGGGALFAEDVVFEPMSDGRQAYVGREAVAQQMREFLSQWDDFRIEALAFRVVGDSVVVTERQRGKGRASGAEIESTFYAVWVLNRGAVVRVRWETVEENALEVARAGLEW
jgi:ketosteroid isomerase-like protein